MTLLAGLLTQLLHAALVLAAAPLLTGGLRRAGARLSGRAGPPVLQDARDLLRLLRKQPVVPEGASVLFATAPIVGSAATAAALLLVPSFTLGMLAAPVADLLLIAGLLALGRVALALAALDAGAASGGLGASRTLRPAVLAEPALLLVILAFAFLAGSTDMDAIAGLAREGGIGPRPALLLVVLVLLGLAVADAAPDDPDLAEAPALRQAALGLEHSGRHLALIRAEAALRLLLWLDLVGALFLPLGLAPAGWQPLAWLVGIACWAAKLVLLGGVLVLLRRFLVAPRADHVPAVLGGAVLLGLLAAILLFAFTGLA